MEGERGGLALPEAGGGSVVIDLLQECTPHRSDQRSNQREREKERERERRSFGVTKGQRGFGGCREGTLYRLDQRTKGKREALV